MQDVDKHSSDENLTRMWSANIVMALAAIIRKTEIKVFKDIIIKMLSYLYLGKNMCKFVVSEMDKSMRSVLCINAKIPFLLCHMRLQLCIHIYSIIKLYIKLYMYTI